MQTEDEGEDEGSRLQMRVQDTDAGCSCKMEVGRRCRWRTLVPCRSSRSWRS